MYTVDVLIHVCTASNYVCVCVCVYVCLCVCVCACACVCVCVCAGAASVGDDQPQSPSEVSGGEIEGHEAGGANHGGSGRASEPGCVQSQREPSILLPLSVSLCRPEAGAITPTVQPDPLTAFQFLLCLSIIDAAVWQDVRGTSDPGDQACGVQKWFALASLTHEHHCPNLLSSPAPARPIIQSA